MCKKLSLLFLTAVLCSFAALAQAPAMINYQGVARNAVGNVLANKTISLRLSIHTGTATGATEYSETRQLTTNTFGLFTTQIGSAGATAVTGSIAGVSWASGNKYLQVEIDPEGGSAFVNIGNSQLVSVPYALSAGNAGASGPAGGDLSGAYPDPVIGAQKVTSTKIADNAITTSKIADASVTSAKVNDAAIVTPKLEDLAVTTAKINNLAVSTTKLADNAVTTIKITDQSVSTSKLADNAVTTAKIADNAVTAAKINTGEIVKSINGLKDNVTLAVSGGATLNTAGNIITIGGTTGDITDVTAGAGLTGGGTGGNVTLSTIFAGNGTSNSSARADHDHINQTWVASTGTGLTLFSNDVNGNGIKSYSNATNFNSAAILAMITANTGQAVGVFGATSSSDASAAGVFGQATNTGGAKAVWGLANGNNTFGIFGQAGGTGSYAGFFAGNVHVNGTLSKAAGSFKIDDPLDPLHKYLSHSFVESPDMMNVYNGNVQLNAQGEATIELPNYFEALNKDFRYQLTSMGKPSPGIYVSQEVSGNRFSIAGGAPGGKISWQVTGIRHDAYAEANRIPVEEVKPASEQGKLLNTIDQKGMRVKARSIEAPGK